MHETETRDRRFLGHPAGLGILAGSELWERFSFYGMQALLMLYMVQRLLLPGHAEHVLGLGGYRATLVSLFGPMTDLAFAAQTFGLYSGFMYMTPLFGAWIADRHLGKTRTVTIGALLMSAGHLTMASERLFLVALLLLIVGAGMVVGNMAAQVGQLYAPDDERRTRAFGIYLVALNVGSLLSPLIAGTLGQSIDWHWGFAACGVGMLIGLATYLWGLRFLPADPPRSGVVRVPLTRADWRHIGALLLVFLPYILVNAAMNQAYGLMLVWADTAVGHTIFGWQVPITWVLTIDGIGTILGVLLATSIWKRLAARGREPSDVTKIGVASVGSTLSFCLIATASLLPVVPLILLVVFYLIQDLAIGWSEAPTASLTSRNAPPQVNAMMMAMFKLAFAFSYFLAGWMGRFLEPLGAPRFWLLTALVAASGGVLVVAFGGRVHRLFDHRPGHVPDAELLVQPA